MNGSVGGAALGGGDDEDDSPLAALDKLVAAADDEHNRRGTQQRQRALGLSPLVSDENSGIVANAAAESSAAVSAPLASQNSFTPAASSLRGGYTGSYAGSAEMGGGNSGGRRSPSTSLVPLLHSQQHPTNVGKPPTAALRKSKSVAAGIGGGGGAFKSDLSSGGGGTAATLSSNSSSPGHLSRDGSGGVLAELAVAMNGVSAAGASSSGGPTYMWGGGKEVPPQQSASAPASAPQSSGSASPAVAEPTANGIGNSAFLVPRNPRDTAPTSSPKRRSRSATRTGRSPTAGKSAKDGGGGGGARSVGAASHASAASSSGAAAHQPHPHSSAAAAGAGAGNVSPTRSHASSSYAQSSYAQISLPSSPQGSGVVVTYLVDTSGTAMAGPSSAAASSSGRNRPRATSAAAASSASSADIIRCSDPDAEEQAMFEQRLCEDEYGVAVRKINSNGRSQLRYVKCVPLAPLDHNLVSGGYGGGKDHDHHGRGVGTGTGAGTGTGTGTGNGTGASVASATRSVTSSTARSVSSLMGRISRSGRSTRRGGGGGGSRSGRDGSVSVERRSGGVEIDTRGAPGGAGGGRHFPSDSPSQASGAAAYGVVDDPEQLRNLLSSAPGRRRLALTWGNKKKVKLGLDRFVCVRKGKTTERTRRNPCHPSQLLSLITDDRANPSLDIEAPTKLDRDKFARAFARFLGVPLEADESIGDESSAVGVNSVDLESKKRIISSRPLKERLSAAHSAPDLSPSVKSFRSSPSTSTASNAGNSAAPQTPERNLNVGLLPAMNHSPSASEDMKFTFNQELPLDPRKGAEKPSSGSLTASQASSSNVELLSDAALRNLTTIGKRNEEEDEEEPDLLNSTQGLGRNSVVAGASAVPSTQAIDDSVRNSMDPVGPDGRHLNHHHQTKQEDEEKEDEDDVGTDVSSLTQGFDQEIVEELHQALTELRAELEASRAEAARAVKVAEQAIQSAESCSSNDWNSTVTHKAAEAAAKAQKRSAEAMAKQREAEERLAKERKSAQFWRKQAEEAEEEKGCLRTRAAAAEVQRSAMASELEGERQRARDDAARLREDRARTVKNRAEELAKAAERNRLLEIELDKARSDLAARSKEAKSLHETLTEIKNNPAVMDKANSSVRKKLGFGRSVARRKSHRGQSLLAAEGDNLPFQSPPRPVSNNSVSSNNGADGAVNIQSLMEIQEETSQLRTELEILRRTAAEEISALPEESKEWVERAASAIKAANSEAKDLRQKLAKEAAMRRKLSDEVQDLRGTVRVFCRPRYSRKGADVETDENNGILSTMSHDVLQMRRDFWRSSNSSLSQPLSFEFDHVFPPGSSQQDVFAEVEKLVLSAMDGYNISLLAFGPRGCGKTHTLIGDFHVSLGTEGSHPVAEIEEYGIHFLSAAQLFSIAEHRRDRFQDLFYITIVEVHNERLRDLLAGTDVADAHGQVLGVDLLPDKQKRGKGGKTKDQTEEDANNNNCNSSQQGNSISSKSGNRAGKLEIRTTYDGDTIVQGLISVSVKSFDDVCRVWKECLRERAVRLAERGVDPVDYEAESHVIATLKIVSTNAATGSGTIGQIQFADLASADLISKRSNVSGLATSFAKQTPMESVLSGVGKNEGTEWKFANRSLGTLLDVVSARCQFSRSVPYRNSTVTHLLRDSLTSDTKVLLMVCVSGEADDIQETTSSLRFASQMRRVTIGKATKHTLSNA